MAIEARQIGAAIWRGLRTSARRLGFVRSRQRLDDDARRELEAHLDLLTDRYVRAGLTRDAAYTQARRQLGNPALVRQELYDMNGIAWIDSLGQDVRYALRQVRRAPGFAAVVITTLALGIGGTTAVFSVVESVLLAPLPYAEPGQLVRLYQQNPRTPDVRSVIAATHFTFLRDHAASFEDVAAMYQYSETGLDLVSDGQASRLRVLRVTSGYFNTLRAAPRLGRGFDRSDDEGTRRVVLSDAVWRTHFGSNPAIVGTALRLSGEEYDVAGVAPPGLDDPVAPGIDAWIPYDLAKDTYEENYALTGIGRLRNGVTLEQARAELATFSQPMKERWPAASLHTIIAFPLQGEVVQKARGPLRLLFAAVGLVLLVVCVNVANLILVRATGRVHEFAVRSALGSNRRRLVRQLLVESLMLAGLGALLGVALATVGIDVLRDLGRDAIPRIAEVGLDLKVLAFAALTAVVTALACSIAPALGLSRTPPTDALRRQGRSATGTRGSSRLRNGMAAAQLALALTLLAGAATLLVSLSRLHLVDLGFRVERVLTFEINLPTVRYDAPRRAGFQEELARRLEAIPGVVAAGGISRLPATGSYHPWNTSIRSGPLAGKSVRQVAAPGFALQQRVVSGNAFAAFEIPLLAGRTFDDRDAAGTPMRVVVGANLARQAFPGLPFESVIGQRLASVGELEIVGIVGDVALDAYGAPTLVVYRSHRQFATNRNWALTHTIATSVPPESIVNAVRTEVARLDPELVVHRVAPMTDVVGRGTSRERFALVLMATFATIALFLAALGLYGVLAYSVRQRTQEIGIRMALGATGAQVRTLVIRQAALVLGIGVALGIVGALALGRSLSSLLFDVSPSDPRTLLAAGLLLSLVGAAAAWLPARRASRVEPRVAMHDAH